MSLDQDVGHCRAVPASHCRQRSDRTLHRCKMDPSTVRVVVVVLLWLLPGLTAAASRDNHHHHHNNNNPPSFRRLLSNARLRNFVARTDKDKGLGIRQGPTEDESSTTDTVPRDVEQRRSSRRRGRHDSPNDSSHFQSASSQPWRRALRLLVSRLGSDPARVGRVLARGVQLGIVAYLMHAVWAAVAEMVDEANNNHNSNDGASSLFHRDVAGATAASTTIPALLQFMEQNPEDIRDALELCHNNNNKKRQKRQRNRLPVPPMPLLQLAYKLHGAGIPLRDDTSPTKDSANSAYDNNDNDNAPPPLPSVERLLSTLTRSEVNLLQQCLWDPPPREEDVYEDTPSDPSNHFLRNTADYRWEDPQPHNTTTRTTTGTRPSKGSDAPQRSTQEDSFLQNVAGLSDVKRHLLRLLNSIVPVSSQPTVTPTNNKNKNNNYEQYASLFGSSLTSDGATKRHNVMVGSLLYGPPGCGKTLLVKGLASVANVPCLVIAPSVLLRKYVGDTNLQVRTLFSLAAKLAPCIICIDELDGLFRERSDSEHEVSRDLKTEFLQWWDGMLSSTQAQHPILVIGATNRPFDVDSAVLRRLPQSHHVGLPPLEARLEFLTKALAQVPTSDQINLVYLAERTEGYSPSDLRQVLQTAALSGPMGRPSSSSSSHGISTEDVLHALAVIAPTPLTPQYQSQLQAFTRGMPNQPSFRHSPPPQHQRQPHHGIVSTNEQGLSKWETTLGNFYNVGTLEVDSETFDLLSKVLDKELEDSDEWDIGGGGGNNDGDDFEDDDL